MATTGVHISDVLTYKTCRRAWNWSSPLRKNLEPSRPYAPFVVGTAVHHALEQFYKNGIPMQDAAREYVNAYAAQVEASGFLTDVPFEADQLEDQAFLIFGMLETYELWRQQDHSEYNDREWAFHPDWVELNFQVPLLNPEGRPSNKVHLEGRMDAVARHIPTGKLWVWEFKTCRSLSERASLLPFDEQASAYLTACQQLFDEPIEGIVYTLLRKKIPTAPKPLKNGYLSDAKNIDTTYYRFVRDALAYYQQQFGPGFGMKELQQRHGELLMHLASKPDMFIWRLPLRRSVNELRTASRHLWQVAMEMSREETDIYPHGGFHCQFCRFRRPCQELNLGADDLELGELLGGEYRVKKGYYGESPLDRESIPQD